METKYRIVLNVDMLTFKKILQNQVGEKFSLFSKYHYYGVIQDDYFEIYPNSIGNNSWSKYVKIRGEFGALSDNYGKTNLYVDFYFVKKHIMYSIFIITLILVVLIALNNNSSLILIFGLLLVLLPLFYFRFVANKIVADEKFSFENYLNSINNLNVNP